MSTSALFCFDISLFYWPRNARPVRLVASGIPICDFLLVFYCHYEPIFCSFLVKGGCLGYRVWKLRVRALSNGANRVIVWGFVLTGYKLVTDGQTVLPMLKVVPGHLSVYHYIRQRCWWLFWSFVCLSAGWISRHHRYLTLWLAYQ